MHTELKSWGVPGGAFIDLNYRKNLLATRWNSALSSGHNRNRANAYKKWFSGDPYVRVGGYF